MELETDDYLCLFPLFEHSVNYMSLSDVEIA
jgi:hypothetical protein